MKRVFLLLLLAAPSVVAGPIVGLTETQHWVMSFDTTDYSVEFTIPIAHGKPIRPNWEFIISYVAVTGTSWTNATCTNSFPQPAPCTGSNSFTLQMEYGGLHALNSFGTWLNGHVEVPPGETVPLTVEQPFYLWIAMEPYTYGPAAPSGELVVNGSFAPHGGIVPEMQRFEIVLDVEISSAFEAPEPSTLPMMASGLGLLLAAAGVRKFRAGRGKR
ncbi:MAG: PEP-CTERM sorting domain-containing protein [Acidobacteria bacterium]|nr:PEP-CTERM sorting domain-containing protein [Acidobacteriota bacterium]